MKKPDEWMPLHVRKYLGDTMHLTTEQHGAYLLLLMAYWMRGGPLPANDNELAAIVRMSRAAWARVKTILEPFFTTVDGKWVQKRAEEELATARGIVAAKSEAGKAGAAARWQNDAGANGKRMADASGSQWQNDAPLPSPKPFRKKQLAAPLGRFDEFWLVCPKKTGRGAAEKAWPKAVSQASEQVLIDAMRAYAGSVAGKDKTFTKTPGPWLNGKHWLDEGIAPGEAVDPAVVEEAKDKADRYFKRGKYAEVFQ